MAQVPSTSSTQLSHSQQDLQDLVALAIEEGQQARSHRLRGRRQRRYRAVGHRAPRRSRDARVSARSRDGHHRLSWPAQRHGEHRRPRDRRRFARPLPKHSALLGFTAEDECAGLPDPEDLAREFPDLQLSHPWGIEPDAARDLAVACEAAALNCRQAHRQFRRRDAVESSRPARVRQFTRLPRRLSEQHSQLELCGRRARRRRDAA